MKKHSKIFTNIGMSIGILCLLVGTILLISSCGGSYFVAADTEFDTSGDVSKDIGEVTSALVTLGYDVEVSTGDLIETKVDRFYYNQGSIHEVELQTWIVVYPKTGRIKATCTERRMWSYHHRTMKLQYDKSWKFTPCKNAFIMNRLNTAVSYLEKLGTPYIKEHHDRHTLLGR